MFLRLIVLFVTVPLIELYLLLQLANLTGPWPTFLLVVVTGIIGSWLAKREGLIAWKKFHDALGEGRVPGREIQDGLMIVFAAALLLTPGLLTDCFGFLMLIPVGRDLIRRFVLAKLFRGFGSVQIHTTTFRGSGSYSDANRHRDSEAFGGTNAFDASRLHPYDDPNTIEAKATRR